MMTNALDGETVSNLLLVVADLLRGDRHSRQTIAKATGKSLPTADRWIDQIEAALPSITREREGKTTWIRHDGRPRPSRSAAAGACIAASLATIFHGSAQERQLKDARDYILEELGESRRDLERKFILAPRGGEYALPEAGPALDTIVSAIVESRRLRFEYTHNDGRTETLNIAPLSLVIFDSQLYVLSRKGEGFYPYRFSRMDQVQALAERFQYPTKGEYDPKSILSQGFGIHVSSSGAIEDVEVLLSEPWATYALTHKWHPSQSASRVEDQKVRVRFQSRMCRELETWALSFGEFAEVNKPTKLREIVACRLRTAADHYAPGPEGGAERLPLTTDSRSGPSLAKVQRAKPQSRRKTR